MTDSLAKSLVANGLQPDSFTASKTGEGIFLGELPAGGVLETWIKLTKTAKETKYWPIICGGSDDIHEQVDRDPESILASAPRGTIRELLQSRMQRRRESLAAMLPEFAAATDMDHLAELADASGIYSFSFGGPKEAEQKWPAEADAPTRVSLHTLKERKGRPLALLLVRVEHSYEVPAHLGFGGWNDCPPPELQVAVLREWGNEYWSHPACITGDVLECVVVKRPQTEPQSMKLAAEQWIFCEDIVGQGTQSVRKLAMSIWRSASWYFWWD